MNQPRTANETESGVVVNSEFEHRRHEASEGKITVKQEEQQEKHGFEYEHEKEEEDDDDEEEEEEDGDDDDDDEEEEEDDASPEFRANVSNAQIIASGLRGIFSGRKEQHASVEVDEDGVKFITTDNSKSLQATASISERAFDLWELKEGLEVCSFRVNLAVLLDCLACISKAKLQHTVLKMAFFSREECFSVQLFEEAVLTECKIRTMFEDTEVEHESEAEMEEDRDGYAVKSEEENGTSKRRRVIGKKSDGRRNKHKQHRKRRIGIDALDFAGAFRMAPLVNKAIISSELLRQALNELSELPGATMVSILMSPQYPFFRLTAHGQSGSCDIEFPHGEDSFSHFDCTIRMRFDYRLSLVKQAGKALSLAEESFVRMNSEGMLNLQHMLRHPNGMKTYVDVFVLADAGDEQDDQEEQEEARYGGTEEEEEEEEE